MFNKQIRKISNNFLSSIGQSSDSICLPNNFDILVKSSFNDFTKMVSIPLRKTSIYPEKIINEEKTCIAIDMGGTHFRCAKVSFLKNGKYYISNKKKLTLPAINRETEVDDFYDSIANYIRDFLSETKKIGFCFSYDMEVDKNLDALLLGFGKKYVAPKLLGTKIAENTLKAINRIQPGNYSIHLVNDSTAALLGGMNLKNDQKNKTYVALIFGTGFNIGYLERINDALTVINTECGEFNFFKPGLIDKDIMEKSLDQGLAQTEKMIAGTYLADLMLGVIQNASEKDLLPKVDTSRLQSEISLKMINDFLLGEKNMIYHMYNLTKHRVLVKHLCYGIIDRSAKIAAILTAIFSLRAKNVNDSSKNVGIVVEGTTFHHLKSFKKRYNKYLKKYLRTYGITYHFIYHEDINLIGAAKSA